MNAPLAFELEMTRVIRAPRERVYDAFVTADLLGAWHCPRGLACRSATTEARVGGRYRIVMQARDGSTFTVGGEDRELVRPERLQFTWRWENETMPQAETLVTVTLSPHDEGTHLHLHHSGFPDAAFRDSHGQGWDSTFGRLCDFVDARGTAASLTRLGDPRSTYVRSARMGFAEKGVAVTLVPASPRSPEIAALHPFARIPVLRDGELVLCETSAILRRACPGRGSRASELRHYRSNPRALTGASHEEPS